MNDYYKAYDERYKRVHETNNLWEYFKPTPDVKKFIDENAKKNDTILDLGCGEGRDAIFLLREGYNIEALDYSKEAIKTCQKNIPSEFKNNFFQLDIFDNNFQKKYNYIYSVCVLHMFVLEEHRNNFYKFVYHHLADSGKALIIVLGDDILEKETNPEEAFLLEERNINNSNIKVKVPKTSCKIMKIKDINKEIENNGFLIEKQWISKEVPGFSSTICTVIKNIKNF